MMRFVDEFRGPELIAKTASEIRRLADPKRRYRIMEVCGGHTHAIYRFGLKDLLPPNIELVHGPGCPVCVLPMGRIDDGLSMGDQNCPSMGLKKIANLYGFNSADSMRRTFLRALGVTAREYSQNSS